MQGRVLTIAGSDSGGGAGIQADLKTVTALGGYGTSAITALTAQNTLGVTGVMPVPPAFIVQQIEVVLQDIGADAIKTGMLHSADVIEAVADALTRLGASVPLVIDPVMVAASGATLLQEEAVTALKESLLPLAGLLTPNLPEAEKLLGHPIKGVEEMRAAAQELRAFGPQAVLLKGGHMEGNELVDVLATAEGVETYRPHPRHRLHPCLRNRNRPGSGFDAARFGHPGARLSSEGDRGRSRHRKGPWAGRPWPHRATLYRLGWKGVCATSVKLTPRSSLNCADRARRAARLPRD
jgi:hydroxymethylpyrimidine/phosphomethylpyrimidine kinase